MGRNVHMTSVMMIRFLVGRFLRCLGTARRGFPDSEHIVTCACGDNSERGGIADDPE